MSSPGQQYSVVQEASLTNWQITEVTLQQAKHDP